MKLLIMDLHIYELVNMHLQVCGRMKRDETARHFQSPACIFHAVRLCPYKLFLPLDPWRFSQGRCRIGNMPQFKSNKN